MKFAHSSNLVSFAMLAPFLVVLLGASNVHRLPRIDGAEQLGFVLAGGATDSEFPEGIRIADLYRRSDDDSYFVAEILGSRSRNANILAAFDEISEVQTGNLPRGTASGLPLGEASCRMEVYGSWSSSARLDDRIGQGRVQYKVVRESDGSVVRRGNHRGGEELLAEGGARHALGFAVGEKLADAPDAIVDGTRIRGTYRNADGKTLVDVTEYAAAMRMTLRRNATLGTIQLEKSDKVAILPLAADKFKLSGTWSDAGAFTALRDARMVAPLAALQAFFR